MIRARRRGAGFRYLFLSSTALGALLVSMLIPAERVRGEVQASPKPRRGGSISVNFSNEDCLNQFKSGLLQTDFLAHAWGDTLVSMDNHGHVHPELASKWKFSRGGRVITFYLRPGVRFSDGKPLTASVAKYTFDQKFTGVPGYVKTAAISKYDLRVTFKAPNRPLLPSLAFSPSVVDPVSLSKENGNGCQSPVGTGPFKVQHVGPSYNPIVMARNPFYTGKAASWGQNKGKAYLAGIVFKPSASATTAINELLTGELDVLQGVPREQLARVQHVPQIHLYRTENQNVSWLGFNESHPPFNRADVRRAIAEAIDKKSILKGTLGPLGAVANSVVPARTPFYDKKSAKYVPKYDPVAAKAFFARNHITGPFTILTYPGNGLLISQIIQADLAQVGVTVSIVTKGSSADLFAALQNGQFDMNLFSWGGVYDPDELLEPNFLSSNIKAGGQNYTFDHDKTLDQLITQGAETTNRKKVALIYSNLQRYMVDKQVIVVPLMSSVTIFAIRTRVHGWHTNSIGDWPVWQDLWVGK